MLSSYYLIFDDIDFVKRAILQTNLAIMDSIYLLTVAS